MRRKQNKWVQYFHLDIYKCDVLIVSFYFPRQTRKMIWNKKKCKTLTVVHTVVQHLLKDFPYLSLLICLWNSIGLFLKVSKKVSAIWCFRESWFERFFFFWRETWGDCFFGLLNVTSSQTLLLCPMCNDNRDFSFPLILLSYCQE